MADERPQGGAGDRRWLYAGLAAGGLAFVYVWWKNRGGSSSSSDGSSSGAVDSAGGSASPTDLRDILQVNYRQAPPDKEDNQPTVHHKPKPKRKKKAA